ncbi:MAG: arginyl-tRNA-protein transferase, partial [Phycisphaerales bacterium]|nr:arginyl-tRNA-protein transferase [Phycisphaerales bacterium]
MRLRLADTGDHACPYLPGRTSTNRAFRAEHIPPLVYQAFMDAAFRRSGTIVYQPACRGCRACVPLRVPVATFTPSTSQRRAWRKNQDLTVTVGPPEPDAERFRLYCKYVTEWHGKSAGGGGEDGAGDDEESYDAFASFLYESPVETLEWRYRDPAGRLVGVGICDLSDVSLSSVYFYHDPAEARRGLGTFAALYEIEECRRLGVPYYYLGYWVDGCGAMSYRAS